MPNKTVLDTGTGSALWTVGRLPRWRQVVVCLPARAHCCPARHSPRTSAWTARASFPFPLYSTWFQTYSQNTSDVQIDYQSTGSGAGVQAFINHTVDFAASDAAMTDEQISKVDGAASFCCR